MSINQTITTVARCTLYANLSVYRNIPYGNEDCVPWESLHRPISVKGFCPWLGFFPRRAGLRPQREFLGNPPLRKYVSRRLRHGILKIYVLGISPRGLAIEIRVIFPIVPVCIIYHDMDFLGRHHYLPTMQADLNIRRVALSEKSHVSLAFPS